MGRRASLAVTMVAATLFVPSCGGMSEGGDNGNASPSGSAASIVLLRDLTVASGPTSSNRVLASDGDEAFFIGGNEVGRTQGTANSTHRVTAIPDGMKFDLPVVFLPGPSVLVSALNTGLGYEPWRVDSNGPFLVLDINPLPADAFGLGGSSYLHGSISLGQRAFFAACDGRDYHLYVSDGTGRGTTRLAGPFTVSNIGGDPCLGFVSFWSPVTLGNRLYFLASHPIFGQGLWTSDGTAEGTRQVAQIDPNPHDGTPIQRFIPPPAVADLVVVGNRLFFRGSRDLWISDGTPAGTAPVTNRGLFPTTIIAGSNRVFFRSSTGLWTSDGTDAGTRRLADLRFPDANGTNQFDMGTIGDKAFYLDYDDATGVEVWVADGMTGTTALLRDFNPGPAYGWPTSFVAVGSTMYLVADDGTGRHVWQSDGTASGTRRVGGATPPVVDETSHFVYRSLSRVRNGLVFVGVDSAKLRQLWAIQIP